MLPPTTARRPPSAIIRPVSRVVVVLPFVPVTATMRPRTHRAANSISLITGVPRRRT